MHVRLDQQEQFQLGDLVDVCRVHRPLGLRFIDWDNSGASRADGREKLVVHLHQIAIYQSSEQENNRESEKRKID